jgi:hypothetical protein
VYALHLFSVLAAHGIDCVKLLAQLILNGEELVPAV